LHARLWPGFFGQQLWVAARKNPTDGDGSDEPSEGRFFTWHKAPIHRIRGQVIGTAIRWPSTI
jgi:hypothetical protein